MKICSRCFIFLVFGASVCVSCKKENTDLPPVYPVHANNITTTVPFDSLIEEYQYIPLETSDECLIGEVKQLQVTDELIYVQSQGIYCFDMNGKFCFAINQRGHARSEFVKDDSFNVYDGLLYVYDNSQKKILVFDASDGHYLHTINFPYSALTVFGHGDKLLVDRSDLPCTEVPEDERFFICSAKNPKTIKQRFISTQSMKKSGHIYQSTSMESDGYLCSTYWDNTVWKVTATGQQCYLRIELPKDSTLDENLLKDMMDKGEMSPHQKNESHRDKYWGLIKVHENENFIMGMTIGNNGLLSVIVDKQTKKHLLYRYCEGREWQIGIFSVDAGYKDRFYSIRSSSIHYLLKPDVPTEKPDENSKEWKAYQTYHNINKEDNPVVIMYKLKHLE